MNRLPTSLILDFGGVLTSDLWESIRGCSSREGLAPDALLDVLRGDPGVRDLFAGLERGEVDQSTFEAALAVAAGIEADGLLGRMCADLRPDRRMLDAVATLRGKGIRVGVLSNTWGDGPFSPYVGYDLESRADVLVLSDQVGLRKPESAIYTLTLDRLGVAACSSVFVDDMSVNLSTASAMGMRVIHHWRTSETVAALEDLFAVPL